MGDILKEAIADAKAVRETALQNAKMALEEAFTPQLKSMLSAKLKEDDIEEGDYYEDEEAGEEEEFGDEEDFGGEEEVPAEEGEFGDEEAPAEDEFGDEEDEVEENIIELNGQSFKLVPISEDEEEVPGEEEEEFGDEEDLDLEAVIRELESEISEGDDEEEVTEGSDDDETVDESSDDEETVDEVGSSLDKVNNNDDDANPLKQEGEEEYDIDESLFTEEDDEDEDKEEVDEQSSSSNIGSSDNSLKAASNSDEEDPQGQGVKKEKFQEVYNELKEYKQAVHFLKDKLHEVNILNAKLLFTNKLFKEYILDNDQKLKIVETFDRVQTVREIKLVYSTVAEQLKENTNVSKRKSIKDSVGGSSKAAGSTKPDSSKIITEENKVADRFKELAGLI